MTWREGGENVFFPQQKLIINGQEKIRGGMHPCLPFGNVADKFGMPQHGVLRDLRGRRKSSWWEISGENLTGCYKQPVSVSVSATPRKRGFWYYLSVSLKEEATEAVPVALGLHPYFSTPEGRAYTLYSGEDFEGPPQTVVRRAWVNSYECRRSGWYDLKFYLKGLGAVKMSVGGDFVKAPNPAVVFWRDDLRYLCVEPTTSLPEDFGTERCLWLKPGERATLYCTFEFFNRS